ncbi:MAG TPA: carboxypeptidase-like regulatory domain-containing protein, partial [Bryobacteraceae bacterium]|nr:carboxypeptidase-like regulatory domain-containing protein [Bryobacteraceae bacterium]
MRTRNLVLLAVALLMVCMPAMWAQTASTGSLSGTVTDPSGAVIPNVTVTLTSADTGAVRNAITGADGTYRFGLLAPGNYKVKFSAAGFKPVELPGIVVQVTESPVLNRALEVGAQTEQVTVEANVEAIQTSSSALGTVVGNKTATDLPLTTRNYTNLIGLSAGANASVNNASGFGKGGVDTAVNGAMTQDNNYMMDGVAMTTQQGGSVVQGFYSGMAIPNPDTLQEFKIQTSNYDAGYGRNPGANVNVVTKSGTNEFHGTAFEFFRNTALNATDFFRNRACADPRNALACAGGVKQVLNQNQFGGTVGGPIKKDKLFVFGAYQQTWQKNGAAAQGFSPGIILQPIPGINRGTTGFGAGVDGLGDDAAAANFRHALGAAFCGTKTNPGGAGAGQGMQVDCAGANINPYAMRYLQAKLPGGGYYIPGSGGTSPLSGVAYSIPAYDKEYQGMLNLDYAVNSKHTLTSKYFRSYEDQQIPFLVANGQPSVLPGNPGVTNYGYQNGIIKLTSIVTNSLVNELRGSILRGVNDQTQDPGLPYLSANNIYPGCPAPSNLACAPPGHGILGGDTAMPPQISILGQFVAFGGTNNVFHHQTTAGFGDQVSWTKGKHTMRFGGEWEATRWTWVGSWLSHGIMQFSTFNDFLIGLPGGCGAAALPNSSNPLGCNGSSSSNVLNTSNFDVVSSPSGIVHGYRMKNADGFFQDDFKVSQRLTLNMGLRWEYDGNLSDKYGNAVNLWPTAMLNVPVPSTTETPTPGIPLFPKGGTYAGWVVPSNYTGPMFPGIISSGHTIPTQNGIPKDDFSPRLGFAYQPTKSSRFVMRGGFGFFYNRIDGNLLVHSIEQSPPYAPTLDQPAQTNSFSSLAAPYEQYTLGQFPMRWVNFNGTTSFTQSSNITQSSEAPVILT